MSTKIVYTCNAKDCKCGSVITQDGDDFYFHQTGMDKPELITSTKQGFINGKYSVAYTSKGDSILETLNKHLKRIKH